MALDKDQPIHKRDEQQDQKTIETTGSGLIETIQAILRWNGADLGGGGALRASFPFRWEQRSRENRNSKLPWGPRRKTLAAGAARRNEARAH